MYGDPRSGRLWVSSFEESETERASNTLGLESSRKVFIGGVVWY